MSFRKLLDDEKKLVDKHKEKYGTRSANVFKAHIMRGLTEKEAENKAVDKAHKLPPRRQRRKKMNVNIAQEPAEVENTITAIVQDKSVEVVKEVKPKRQPRKLKESKKKI